MVSGRNNNKIHETWLKSHMIPSGVYLSITGDIMFSIADLRLQIVKMFSLVYFKIKKITYYKEVNIS